MPRLRRSNCSSPGILRRRAGRGFTYLRPDGTPVRDPDVLARIRALAIPPAWTDVWICPWENGHIQALGTDAAGRRQYRYHDAWRTRRDQEKFDHMVEFARCLPGLRQDCGELLQGDGLGADRVLACAVRLLDRGFFRIGTEGYAAQNQTYGLATMRKEHVTISVDDLVRSGGVPPLLHRPRIIDCYDNGVTIGDALHLLGREAVFGELSTQGAFEAAVLDLLVDPPSDQAAA